MKAVTLVSGGLDSSLVAVMAREEGVEQFPLFIDYAQHSRAREWAACKRVLKDFELPKPTAMRIPGYGRVIRSGLTDPRKHLSEEAFLPGRNMMFLLCGAAFAFQNSAEAVMIGLLSEDTHLFPDQTNRFIVRAEAAISSAMGRDVRVIAPLRNLHKGDVIRLAAKRGLRGTYSCHKGTLRACGQCISCLEFVSAN